MLQQRCQFLDGRDFESEEFLLVVFVMGLLVNFGMMGCLVFFIVFKDLDL